MQFTDPAVGAAEVAHLETRLDSYRRLADVYHHILSEQSLDDLLERVADTLAELIPYDTIIVYEALVAERLLVPMLARDPEADQIMKDKASFGRGLTGWAVENREPILANDA